MEFSKEQIEELKQVSPNLRQSEEGGYTYFFLENYPLPIGCRPDRIDLLLCPMPKNGYSSILYYAVKPTDCVVRNWNGNVHVLGRNWYSYSWQTQTGHSLIQMLQIHLNALKK